MSRFAIDHLEGAALLVRVKTPRPRSRIPRTCRVASRVSRFARRWSYLGFAS